jgi:signal transduction histidine kinase/CheY-like chemotaxis protein
VIKSDVIFILENAPWPTLLVNGTSGIIVQANKAAIVFFGAPLEKDNPLFTAVWLDENNSTAPVFFTQWETSAATTVAMKFRNKEGASTPFNVSLCSLARDNQKFYLLQLLSSNGETKTETSLAHKQKLDCALQLARTVSLDFNNALTSILGHTSHILSQTEPTHPWRASLIEVEKSASKAAEIANDLGIFSRQEKETRTQASGNLNSVVNRSLEFFQKSQPLTITWNLQLEKSLFTAKVDEAKMQQAFIKILENAVQAVGTRGRITIQTRNIELTEATQDRNARLAPGTYVCVEISDTGSGITPEVLPRIFEPFFTTKGGQHRGLGLAFVYGIVTNHGGGVAVSSQSGNGTSVRVYLPAEKKLVRDAVVKSTDLNGTETILMVDDEDLLLTMGHTVLSAYGYRVLIANSGQKALEIVEKNDVTIDLVITDLVMPAMSGRELVERIHQLLPGTPILCTSGFVRPTGQEHEDVYLQKPFTSQDLLVKVKQALARQTPQEKP